MNKDIKYNSTHGSRSAIKTESIRVSKKAFVKCMAGCLAAGVIVGGLGAIEVPKVIENFKEKVEITSVLSKYQTDIVSDNTHRTEDKEHYWHDYVSISRELDKDVGTFDEKLFAVYNYVGEDGVNEVLRHSNVGSEYASVSEYMESKNYSDNKDWKKTVYDRISLKNKLEDNSREQELISAELSQMSNESQNATMIFDNEDSYGGK